jgi:radical SAM domain protein
MSFTERYVIHVTKACNMECLYCYEKDKTSKYEWSEIEKLCKNIIENNRDKKNYSVEFLGGEPMMAFDHVKKAIGYFVENDPEHAEYFIITTNGTIITKDLIGLLKNNENIMFSISLDGIPEANAQRIMKSDGSNSYDLVTYGIKVLLLNNVPIEQIAIHMVTHPFNCKMICRSIEDFYSLGIRNISVGTIENSLAVGPGYEENFKLQLYMVAEKIINGSLKGLHIDLFESFDPENQRQRIYIRDENGKMLCESYGVMENDITRTNYYDSRHVVSDLGDYIFNLRKDVCLYYRKLKEKNK